MSAREVHIGLLFHSFASENLGVGAFTVANAAIIGKAIEKHGGSPVFHIIGMRGGKDYSDTCAWQNDFTNVGLKALINPASDLHKVIKQCDAFFDVGAGDSFTDIYGPKRFSQMVGAKVLAARTGKPLIFSPQTIGPFSTSWGKAGAMMTLGRASKIFARDEMSLKALEGFGVQDQSELTTDLAFVLPFERSANKQPEALSEGGLEVGLNVSGLLFAMSDTNDGRIRLKLNYADFTRKVIERLIADPKVARVHIVPHVLVPRMPEDDDGAASKILAAEYPDLVMAPDFASPSEAKSYIASLDLLLGARMHATIAALSSDTAVLPLAYSRKFNGLYGSLGYPYLVDMVNEDEAAALAELDRVMASLPEVAKAAAKSNALAQAKLQTYLDYVDRFAEDMLGQ